MTVQKAAKVPNGTIRFEPVTMTPEEAKKILEKNANSPKRSVSPAAVMRISKEIEDGKWDGRTNVIAFDKLGRLIDGWHRLTAIAAAGHPVMVTVGKGYNPEEIHYFDRGVMARRIRHTLQFNGYEYPKDGDILGWIQRLLSGNFNRPSPEEALSLLERFQEDLEWARSTIGNRVPTTVKAALVFAHHSPTEKREVERFTEQFLLGDSGNSAVKALRQQFDKGLLRGGGTWAGVCTMYRTLRVLRAYGLDEEILRLKTPKPQDVKGLIQAFL